MRLGSGTEGSCCQIIPTQSEDGPVPDQVTSTHTSLALVRRESASQLAEYSTVCTSPTFSCTESALQAIATDEQTVAPSVRKPRSASRPKHQVTRDSTIA